MSEISPEEDQTAEDESFLETPLLFFGNQITLSPPQSYYDELAEHQERVRESVEELLSDADMSDEDRQEAIAWEERNGRFRPNFTLYERRYRGRNMSREFYDQNEDVFSWYYRNEVEVDSSRAFDVMQQLLVQQQWQNVFGIARKLHKTLEDGHSDKELAAAYAGFAGVLILNGFVNDAIAHINPGYEGDEFVSIKHFVSVWWPTAEDVEEFAPDEVAEKKQIFREVMLEYASLSYLGVRRYIAIMLYDDPHYSSLDYHDDSDEVREMENTAFTNFLRMENLSDEKRERLVAKFDRRVDALVQEGEYRSALEFIDAGWRAFSLNPEELQDRVLAIARQGVMSLMQDMDDYLPNYTTQGWFTSSRRCKVDEILASPGVTEELWQEIKDIEIARLSEHLVGRLADEDGTINGDVALTLTEVLSGEKDPARLLKKQQMEQIIDVHQTLPFMMSLRGGDQELENFIRLMSRMPDIRPRITEVLSTMFDIYNESIKDFGAHEEPFEVFIAFISPIFRASAKEDNPDDEYLIDVIGRNNLHLAVDRMVEHAVKHTISGEMNKKDYLGYMKFFSKVKAGIDGDLRGWWNKYWDQRQEY
jgi:hypothetical protein